MAVNLYAPTNTSTNTSESYASTNTSTIQHQLGRSANTIAGDNPALSLFCFWRAHVAKKTVTVSEDEIVDDNLQSMFILYCDWLGRTPIPRYWRVVENIIRPPANVDLDSPIPCLTQISIVKYVGRTVAWFRRAFPTHKDFKDLDATDPQAGPTWWSRLKPKLANQIDDLHQRFDNDFSYGANATRPLYFNNNPSGTNEVSETRDYVTTVDLKWVLKSLMKKANVGHNITDGPLQHRAWLSILYNAVGRPGEIKFVDTANFIWHPQIDVTDIVWLETKTSNLQAMGMLPYKVHYSVDFYHCL